MKIIALDCDGTVIYGMPEGPVDPKSLKKKGYLAIMVSSSLSCVGKEGFDDIIPSGSPLDREYDLLARKKSLLKKHPQPAG